jgi:DNA glycosylase AlkZ-like
VVAELFPGGDVGAMRYTVRTHLPLVQVPIIGGWTYSNKPEFTLAESWLGQPISPLDNQRELLRRYLAAFRPASAADMQTSSGLPKLKELFAELKLDLLTYRDEQRRVLFDLPNAPLPAGDVPAPVRFLPEFDNLLLAHKNRTRIIADEHRSKVYLPALRVAAAVLVDGFVGGVWKIERVKTTLTLVIEPFAKLSRRDRVAASEEGEQLLRFVQPEAKSFGVRFANGH